MLISSGAVRTGIDIGGGAVTLVRGVGSPSLERISHLGSEPWVSRNASDEVRAASALEALLHRLDLSKRSLGRIAIAVPGEEIGVREILMPPMSEEEIRQALPYEVRNHLPLGEAADPVLAFQILGAGPPPEDGGAPQIRVLLAAAPRAQRDFPIRVLQSLGLEPEVVDLEPFAVLNALLACVPVPDAPIAALYLDSHRAGFYVTQAYAGVLSRSLTPPPNCATSQEGEAGIHLLITQVRDTIAYYRSRQRQEIGEVHLAGSAELLTGLRERLAEALHIRVTILNPLENVSLIAKSKEEGRTNGPRFVIACGLCRWWDRRDV
jgi:type IV pilus assembly protein PilM